MTTFKDIDRYIEEYKNPTKLGERILNAIDTKLYTTNPQACSKKLECLYNEAKKQNNSYLSIACLYKWLELTNFKNPEALAALKNIDILNAFTYNATQDLQYKLLNTWAKLHKYYSVSSLFSIISDYVENPTTYLKYINTGRSKLSQLPNFYIPNQATQLKLINSLVLAGENSRILQNKSSDFVKCLTNVISKLDLTTLPAKDAVKLLTLSPYLGKRIINKIQKCYIPENYASVLATAQALGVVENADYWIQNLPSVKQLNSLIISEPLPEL